MPKDKPYLFQPGNPGGKGRGLSGRRKTLDALDKMLSKEGNLKKFSKALQDKFDLDPLKFWKQYVLPVMPQKIALTDLDGDSVAEEFTDKELMDRFVFLYKQQVNGNGKTNSTESAPN